MPIKCVAIDDEPLALELIKNYVKRFPALEMINVFEDAISGAEYLNRAEVDLLFLDVNMPDINGVDLARSLAKSPMIIFTTAYRNYAFESYELQAIDYLLKPIDLKRFTIAVEKAIDFHQHKTVPQDKTEDQAIYIYSEYKMIKVWLKEIEYIESMGDYLKIYQTNADKPLLTLTTMKKLIGKLPTDQFARIHRGFIVSMNKIKSIHNKKVQLEKIELPIGDAYKDFIDQQKGIKHD